MSEEESFIRVKIHHQKCQNYLHKLQRAAEKYTLACIFMYKNIHLYVCTSTIGVKIGHSVRLDTRVP